MAERSADDLLARPADRRAPAHRAAAAGAPIAARFVIDDMVEDMLERLAFLRHEPKRALVIGDWTGALAAALGGRRRGDRRPSPATGFDEERPYPVRRLRSHRQPRRRSTR